MVGSLPASLFASLLAAAGAAFSSWLLLRALIPLLRRRLLDQPTARSSHTQPTPRGGGVVVVLVSLLASALAARQLGFTGLIAVPFIALPLALVGLLDDRHNLPARWRYSVQLLTAALLLAPLGLPWLAWPLLLIAITAVINFTNFMDGLDGLVAGCMAVALSAAALQLAAPWSLWALVGALLGFLIWNWSPARVFMGDVGSTFLGAVFAGVVLQAPGWPEALGLLLVATPLLADACLCVPRRLLAGQPISQAHRLHLFQRLHQAGWPHARVATLYIAATTVLAIALVFGGWRFVLLLALAELLVGLCLDQRVALPFELASKA
jgi:Fuc2NAc and GlcNAc transferase